jgi:hypothetical protein
MALEIFGAAALSRALGAFAQFNDELSHPVLVGLEGRVGRIDSRLEDVHYQPQQSVLNPQAGQRQTACMRYISSPQRSHNILSFSAGVVVLSGVMGRTGARGGVGSDMAAIIA